MILRTRLVGLIAVGVMTGSFGFGQEVHAQAQSAKLPMVREGNSPASIRGAWRVTATIQDCQTHAALGAPFHAVLTFSSDGILGGVTGNPAFLPGQRSPDFGTWRRTDWSTYKAVDQSLILFTGGPFSAGVQTLNHTITISEDRNQFTDDATTQFADFNGTQVTPTPGCATAVGTRIP